MKIDDSVDILNNDNKVGNWSNYLNSQIRKATNWGTHAFVFPPKRVVPTKRNLIASQLNTCVNRGPNLSLKSSIPHTTARHRNNLKTIMGPTALFSAIVLVHMCGSHCDTWRIHNRELG